MPRWAKLAGDKHRRFSAPKGRSRLQDRSKYTPAGPHRNCNHAGISPKQVLRKSTGELIS